MPRTEYDDAPDAPEPNSLVVAASDVITEDAAIRDASATSSTTATAPTPADLASRTAGAAGSYRRLAGPAE